MARPVPAGKNDIHILSTSHVLCTFFLFWFFVQNFLEEQLLCAEFKNDICLVIYQNYLNNHFRVLNCHLYLPRNQIKMFTCPMSQPRNQVSFEHIQVQCFVQIVIATLTDFFVLFFFPTQKRERLKRKKRKWYQHDRIRNVFTMLW